MPCHPTSRYSLASSVFFVTYIPLSIPANVLAQRYGTRPVLSLLMVGFGAVGTCQMLATGLSDLVAIRLVLGVTEAGVYGNLDIILNRFLGSPPPAFASATITVLHPGALS